MRVRQRNRRQMIQAGTLEQARGEPLERWVGRPSVDIDLLFSNLSAHG
jgi:hypothetical protein